MKQLSQKRLRFLQIKPYLCAVAMSLMASLAFYCYFSTAWLMDPKRYPNAYPVCLAVGVAAFCFFLLVLYLNFKDFGYVEKKVKALMWEAGIVVFTIWPLMFVWAYILNEVEDLIHMLVK